MFIFKILHIALTIAISLVYLYESLSSMSWILDTPVYSLLSYIEGENGKPVT